MTAILASAVPWLVYLLGIMGLTWGGNLVCKKLLLMSGLTISIPHAAPEAPSAGSGASRDAAPAAPQHVFNPPTAIAGRFIGSLERLIIMIGLFAGSWEIIAGVIALKAVARFKEIDQRIQAEYFLVGSLASVLWAIIITLALGWYDREAGLDLLQAIMPAPKP
jgi:hypothetical protein